MWQKLDDFAYYLVVSAFSGAVYLIRRVFTNQKQIELLRREIEAREEKRVEANKVIELSLCKLEDGLEEVKEEVRYLRRNQK